jgi:hypothetical protein
MWVDEKKDTLYHWATAGGAEKYIPKYQDKNISLLLTETLNTRKYNVWAYIFR